MEYPSQRKEVEQDDIVETLLRLPVKNLEERVKKFEKEIQKRLNIEVETLTSLGTHQLFFKERARQLHYASAIGNALNTKTHFEIEISKLGIQKTKEILDCFRDISKLQDSIREAREDLLRENLKLKLIE